MLIIPFKHLSWTLLVPKVATCKQIVTSEVVGVVSVHKESFEASDGSSVSLSSGSLNSAGSCAS